ncbi:hypothetical protein V8G54_034535 [Vigna mungo]|uniref:Retrovirus-related Pol polyprotein from transposon TNT 1-94 n=1 Tax=Vigna mungo TaxID=3915 RepID=A0AAQ3MQF7_VIGMU
MKQRTNNPNFEQALQSRVNFTNRGGYQGGKGRGRGRNRGRGNFSSHRDNIGESSYSGGRSNFKHDKSKVDCYKCKQLGHYASECQTKLQREHEEHANVVEIEESMVLACTQGPDVENNDIWYLDTGCSNHMTGKRDFFSFLDESVKGEVNFGNKSKIRVMGKGNISIQSKNGTNVTIADVYYVPGLFWNLLSMGQLLEKRYKVRIDNEVCEIMNKDNKNIARVKMTKNRMFPLSLQTRSLMNFQAMVKDDNWLWHLRFGHLNFRGLKLLVQKQMVTGLPLINAPDNPCESCILGKHHRDLFVIGKSVRAKKPLELIHTDICEPVEVESVGNKRYFLLFVDNYSRKIWVYFLKEKSEAFKKFKEFKVLVEKQSELFMKTLRPVITFWQVYQILTSNTVDK